MNLARVLLALTLLGCSVADATAPVVRIPTNAPSLDAIDLTPPPAPTDVAIAVDSVGRPCDGCDVRVFFAVTWTDNATFADEFNTCGIFYNEANAPIGSGCAYATDYDLPPGSTGVRSSHAFVAVPGTGLYRLSLYTTRRIPLEDGRGWPVYGPYSEPAFVDMSGVVVAATKRKGKK